MHVGDQPGVHGDAAEQGQEALGRRRDLRDVAGVTELGDEAVAAVDRRVDPAGRCERTDDLDVSRGPQHRPQPLGLR